MSAPDVPCLRKAPPAAADAIAALKAKAKDYGRGAFEAVPEESIPFDHGESQVIHVEYGAVKLVARASRAREQVVAFHFAGDLIQVPARGLHGYSLVALTPSRVTVIPLHALLDDLANPAGVLVCLLNASIVSLARCREKAVALGQKTAGERVAGFLHQMGERIGRRESDHVVIRLPMSRRDIADSLGLTIETVSRQLTILRQAGIIATRGRADVALYDLGGLASRAGYLGTGG